MPILQLSLQAGLKKQTVQQRPTPTDTATTGHKFSNHHQSVLNMYGNVKRGGRASVFIPRYYHPVWQDYTHVYSG